MSESIDPIANQPNPYVQSTLTSVGVVPRPTGVVVTGVLCCLGGALGIIMCIVVVVQLLAGNAIAEAFTPPGAAGDAQRAMNDDIAAINASYIIPNVGLTVASVAVSICLVVGGVGIFMTRQWAPNWIRKVLLFTVMAELLRLVLYSMVQFEMYPVMLGHMEALAEASSANAPPQAAEMIKSLQRVGMIVGIVMGAAWFLVKLVLILWGRYYLARPHVMQFFGMPTNSEA